MKMKQKQEAYHKFVIVWWMHKSPRW